MNTPLLSFPSPLSSVRLHPRKIMAQKVKNPPAMQETRVLALGREDPLEKEMATHSNILAWRIPWTGKPGRVLSMESDKSQTRLIKFHFHFQDRSPLLVIGKQRVL